MLARPGLPDFEYLKAGSPQEVFNSLKEKGPDIKLMMGGTDLFIQMRDRDSGPGTLLDIKGLPGMQAIEFGKPVGLKLGAAVTLNQISADKDVQKYYPVLCQAADTVGNYQLRNRATLGGNICNASPSADMAPALLIYEAEVVLESPSGERQIPVEEFWLGPGKTVLEEDEYLKAIHFPLPPEGAVGHYYKLGRSKMGDLAIVGVGVLGYPDPDSSAGLRFKIGINSTAPTPYRVPAVEDYLAQHTLSDDVFSQAAEDAMDISAPIEDVRATALYQKKMVRNLTLKGLKEIRASLK
jgi:CO/xanthine dehydrogenase FAD-binding subunit